ncbi:PD-(D/E)XK nuclease family protein [Paenibacillus polymyxa]|uniref:PD-(D/E)XK nuclease family protein n=1 Tax=Paenibacillus polymyxa TaxID=1406 RepID=UPI0020191967|nr:PD-(D/E)XK nuclease family protein [Paenibacillus polymyxa]UQQ36174.1 PD-(D/E)XK nuclease family protein [Paenibacillus polymyxa]
MINRYPEFSWSITRHNSLSMCSRQYYLNYYVSPFGRRRDSTSFKQHAFRLKHLQKLPMIFGSSVHEQIHRTVNQLDDLTEPPVEQEIMANIRDDLNKAYCDSKYRQHMWYDRPSDYRMLAEIYYDNELSLEAISDTQEKLPATVRNLVSCNTMIDLFQRRKETELITAERFRCMEVNGVKVWVVLDLLFRDLGKGTYVVTDFKSGKRKHDDHTQLILYARYIKEAFQISSLEQIELRNEYLSEGSIVTYTPTTYDFEKIEYLIQTSIEWMRSYLQDAEHNIPLEMEAFEQTKHQGMCKNCQYRELCGKA